MPVAYDRAPTFSGMIAEKDVAVPMRDGVNLSVDIYRPDDGGKFPALLAFAIYNKDLQGPDVANALPPQPAWSSLWAGPLEAADTKFFVSRGYVHIIGCRAASANPTAAARGNGTATISSNGSRSSHGATAMSGWSAFPASAPNSYSRRGKARRI